MIRILVVFVILMGVLSSGALAKEIIDFEDLKRKGGSGEKSWTLDGVSVEAVQFMRQYADMDGDKAKSKTGEPPKNQKDVTSIPGGSGNENGKIE